MKTNSLLVVCLSFLLFHIHFSFAKRFGGGFGGITGKLGGFGKAASKATNILNRGSTHTNTNLGGYPKQHRQRNPGSYPRQQGGGGFPNHYPAQGSPYGGYGGYTGSYINQNPNNKVLSPHYGGSFGYGGYGARGGSPFFHSVQAISKYPTDESREFGHSAVRAAAGGAIAGMALGYGLGRFPRPHFSFHSPQEEYYYNHYMYRKYGVKSTDTNDYSRDYKYTPPGETYDRYMDSCLKRADLLPAENLKPNNNPAAVTTATVVTSAPDTSSNTAKTNSTATENSSATISPRPGNLPESNPVPPASQTVNDAEDDDTVSIVEIGYPALIEQLKARRCLELYLVYSEKYLKREAGGSQGLEMGLKGLLAVVTSIILMLLNSNMLLH